MPASKVKAIPEGFHTITPQIVCAGAAKAIEFYKKAFNAVEEFRLPGPDGKLIHACIKIGNSRLMLTDEMQGCGALGPTALKGTPVTLHLYFDNVNVEFERALHAGATVKMPLADMFWGDRYGIVEDPFGHQWSMASHQRDLTPEQIAEGFKETMATQ
jgi:uncharacterized glyoxalase superfamily protein PhnB